MLQDEINTDPIQWLLKYITGRLENVNPDFFRLCENLVKQGRLQPGIDLYTDQDNVNAVSVSVEGKISINQRFIKMMWAICYGVATQMIFRSNAHPLDDAELKQAEDVYDWGLSLKWGDMEWIPDLPNPKNHETSKLCAIANNLFLNAISFVLCHEIGHVFKNHECSTPNNEYEADKFAQDMMLKGRDGSEKDNLIEAGILFGLGAMIIFSPSVKDSKTHPASYKRLERFLVDNFNSEPNHPIWALAAYWLETWSLKFNIGLTFGNFSTPKEFCLDAFKQLNNCSKG